MRRRTPLPAVLVAVAVVTSFTAQAVAAAPRELPGPSLPPAASAASQASAALAAAQALFAEASPAAARRPATTRPDATMALNRLLRVYDDLSPAEQRSADRLLARPTAANGDGTAGYETAEAPPACSASAATPICVHYVTTTDDAPPLTDTSPANRIPDEVDRALATAESVHATYVEAGYRRPDPDGAIGGRDDQVDIYLAEVGDLGLYGYCTTDQPAKGDGTWNYWAYCVIDNDWAEFPAHTPLENQQVTLAHEYFHAVQFAYDASEDGWFMEATATWAEEQLFDDVDDNRQYLTEGQLGSPGVSLDTWLSGESHHYGNWIFFQYLTQRWPDRTGTLPTLVRELIEQTSGRAGDPDLYSTQALQSALAARGTSFTAVYGQFVDANRRPALTYPEGPAYPVARPAKTWTLSPDRRGTGEWVGRPRHLASLPLRFKPDGLGRRDWRIRLQVDMPARRTAPVARVAVYFTSGQVQTSTIRLDRRTRGSRTVPFSSRTVRYVELVLVNASRRTECWSADWTYSCMGTPLDDRAGTDFKATILRR